MPWTAGEVGDLHQYADRLIAGANISTNGHLGAIDGAGNNMSAGQPRDTLAIAQNGGSDIDDGDLSGDGDDSMDDDMMDKISSSPSIEDGGFAPSSIFLWPRRTDSLYPPPSPFNRTPTRDARFSSPYLEHLQVYDLNPTPERGGKAFLDSPRRHHHRLSASGYNLQDRPILTDREPISSTFDTP